MKDKSIVIDANIVIRAVLGSKVSSLLKKNEDWPIIACAMLHQCPIWTEDSDFFGTGIANWTTDRIHIYLLTLPPNDN